MGVEYKNALNLTYIFYKFDFKKTIEDWAGNISGAKRVEEILKLIKNGTDNSKNDIYDYFVNTKNLSLNSTIRDWLSNYAEPDLFYSLIKNILYEKSSKNDKLSKFAAEYISKNLGIQRENTNENNTNNTENIEDLEKLISHIGYPNLFKKFNKIAERLPDYNDDFFVKAIEIIVKFFKEGIEDDNDMVCQYIESSIIEGKIFKIIKVILGASKKNKSYELTENSHDNFRCPKAKGTININKKLLKNEFFYDSDKTNNTINNIRILRGILGGLEVQIEIPEEDVTIKKLDEENFKNLKDSYSNKETPSVWITEEFVYVSNVSEPIRRYGQSLPPEKVIDSLNLSKKNDKITDKSESKKSKKKETIKNTDKINNKYPTLKEIANQESSLLRPQPISNRKDSAKNNSLTIRADRGKGQKAAMSDWSAYAYAMCAKKQLKSDTDKINENVDYEWLHIRGAGLGGATNTNNLMAGTAEANSLMIPLESRIKYWARRADDNHPFNVTFKGSDYHENQAPNLGKEITIEIIAPEGVEADKEKDNHADLAKIKNPFVAKFDLLKPKRNERFMALFVKGPLQPQPITDKDVSNSNSKIEQDPNSDTVDSKKTYKSSKTKNNSSNTINEKLNINQAEPGASNENNILCTSTIKSKVEQTDKNINQDQVQPGAKKEKINLNKVNENQLIGQIEFVGKVRSKNIIAYRKKCGFYDLEKKDTLKIQLEKALSGDNKRMEAIESILKYYELT